MKVLGGMVRRLGRRLRRGRDLSYVHYLQEVAADSAITTLRSEAFALLRLKSGDSVVDVGCGPGTVTVLLGAIVGQSGRVVGVDIDRQMIAAADSLAAKAHLADRVAHRIDDCTGLSFGSGIFDACYCERVLQHLRGDDPSRAVAEMLRVLKPGGRLVVIDTDWSSVLINSDQPALHHRVVIEGMRRFVNPTAGALLPQLLSDAGAVDVHTEFRVLNITAGHGTAAILREAAENALSADESAQWFASLERAREAELPFGQIKMTSSVGAKPQGTVNRTAQGGDR
jgi:ubiquinone/menaquinone biosynthesis C-methylase UbiE